MSRGCRKNDRGMTLVEIVTCLVILGVAIAAGAQAVGSFAAGSMAWRERSVAFELANALMGQITVLPFNDPDGSTAIGRDSGETAGDRTTYDDIDDYNGWDASPPKDTANASMTAYTGYRQQVTVAFDESLSTFTGVSLTANTYKKITVTISKDNRALAKLVTVRAKQSGMAASH